MANIGFTITTAELPEAQDFSPVPAGRYTAMIVNSSLKPTNKTKEIIPQGMTYDAYLKTNPKASGFLALEIDLLDGAGAGRKVFHNLNLINDSERTVEIAMGQLKQLLGALGMPTWSGESNLLHNKRFSVNLAVEVGDDYVKDCKTVAGKPQNVIKKFLAAGTAAATSPVASGGSSPATPAWKRQAEA